MNDTIVANLDLKCIKLVRKDKNILMTIVSVVINLFFYVSHSNFLLAKI